MLKKDEKRICHRLSKTKKKRLTKQEKKNLPKKKIEEARKERNTEKE